MHMPAMKVGEILEQVRDLLELERVGGTQGLERVVEGADISSPGLALAGYVKRFVARRLQVFGETEVTYLFSLDATTRRSHLAQFFSFQPLRLRHEGARAAGRRRRGGDEGGRRHPAVRAQDARVLQPDQALARRRLRAADHDPRLARGRVRGRTAVHRPERHRQV
jgi:hypothetical protein